jgi:hypothetical protein
MESLRISGASQECVQIIPPAQNSNGDAISDGRKTALRP